MPQKKKYIKKYNLEVYEAVLVRIPSANEKLSRGREKVEFGSKGTREVKNATCWFSSPFP